jgi:hypothetical protein
MTKDTSTGSVSGNGPAADGGTATELVDTLVLEVDETETIVQQVPDTAARPARPRTRWGAVVWGLIVTATAAFILFIGSDAGQRSGFSIWLGGLTPVSIGLIVVLGAGIAIMLIALLAVVRRAQRRA